MKLTFEHSIFNAAQTVHFFFVVVVARSIKFLRLFGARFFVCVCHKQKINGLVHFCYIVHACVCLRWFFTIYSLVAAFCMRLCMRDFYTVL